LGFCCHKYNWFIRKYECRLKKLIRRQDRTTSRLHQSTIREVVWSWSRAVVNRDERRCIWSKIMKCVERCGRPHWCPEKNMNNGNKNINNYSRHIRRLILQEVTNCKPWIVNRYFYSNCVNSCPQKKLQILIPLIALKFLLSCPLFHYS
jgi:ferredoxin